MFFFCSDHNKTHAADVLHAVSYLMFEIIPEFSHAFASDSSERERKVEICVQIPVGFDVATYSVVLLLLYDW